MNIVYVGESWSGSNARSLRESLVAFPGVTIDDIGEDQYVPQSYNSLLKAVYRALRPIQRAELIAAIEKRFRISRPNALVAYKGKQLTSDFIKKTKESGILTVNIFPDCSPHAHGELLRRAMGEYDLVISTKPYHPQRWRTIYGYENSCVFVPNGYDPQVHYWSEPPVDQDLDVVMIATYRDQYGDLAEAIAPGLVERGLRVAIAGTGWEQRRKRLPSSWGFPGGIVGRAYGEFARRGKIVIAPLHVENMVNGRAQPGDVDSTRSYELAAMGCFFLHRQSEYLEEVYEPNEVRMWETPAELVDAIAYFMSRPEERRSMALAAQRRAVPSYSIPVRAETVLRLISDAVRDRK